MQEQRRQPLSPGTMAERSPQQTSENRPCLRWARSVLRSARLLVPPSAPCQPPPLSADPLISAEFPEGTFFSPWLHPVAGAVHYRPWRVSLFVSTAKGSQGGREACLSKSGPWTRRARWRGQNCTRSRLFFHSDVPVLLVRRRRNGGVRTSVSFL